MERGIGFLHHLERLEVHFLSAQVVGNAHTRTVEAARGRGAAKVAVDEEHAPALEGHDHGQVDAHEGLARTGVEGGDNVDVVRVFGIGHELEVGAEQAECLVHPVLLAKLDDDGRVVGATLGALAEEGNAAALFAEEGNFAHHGEVGNTGDVLFRAHRSIEVLAHEDDECGEKQARQAGCGPDGHAVGRGGEVAAVGHVDYLGVERGVGHADFVFLFLLEEVEVEALLHLLFALYGDEVLGLFGVGGNFAAGLAAEVVELLELDVDGLDLPADGGEDVLAHFLELLLLTQDAGVLCRGTDAVVLELEQHVVVVGNLALDLHVVQPRIGRQELVAGRLVPEDLQHILGHAFLVVEAEDFGLGTALLLKVDVADVGEVGDAVAGLEGGDAVVDHAEVLFHHAESLVDEARGTGGHLVALFEPLLVVDADEGLEHFFGTLGGIVDELEVDDGGLLVVDGCLEAALQAHGGMEEVALVLAHLHAAGHLGEDAEGGELAHDVGDVGLLLHEGHFAEVLAAGVARLGLAERFLLHEDGGFAGEEVGGAVEVEGSARYADDEGDDEPVPVALAEVPKVLHTEEVFGGLALGMYVFRHGWEWEGKCGISG